MGVRRRRGEKEKKIKKQTENPSYQTTPQSHDQHDNSSNNQNKLPPTPFPHLLPPLHKSNKNRRVERCNPEKKYIYFHPPIVGRGVFQELLLRGVLVGREVLGGLWSRCGPLCCGEGGKKEVGVEKEKCRKRK